MVCQYLQDMASEEKLILLMVYDILVLQQRRVVAAYKQPRGDGECGGAEGSGCDAKVSQQSLHAGGSGASPSLKASEFWNMLCQPSLVSSLFNPKSSSSWDHFWKQKSGGPKPELPKTFFQDSVSSQPIMCSCSWAYYNHKKLELEEVLKVTQCNSCCHKCCL